MTNCSKIKKSTCNLHSSCYWDKTCKTIPLMKLYNSIVKLAASHKVQFTDITKKFATLKKLFQKKLTNINKKYSKSKKTTTNIKELEKNTLKLINKTKHTYNSKINKLLKKLHIFNKTNDIYIKLMSSININFNKYDVNINKIKSEISNIVSVIDSFNKERNSTSFSRIKTLLLNNIEKLIKRQETLYNKLNLPLITPQSNPKLTNTDIPNYQKTITELFKIINKNNVLLANLNNTIMEKTTHLNIVSSKKQSIIKNSKKIKKLLQNIKPIIIEYKHKLESLQSSSELDNKLYTEISKELEKERNNSNKQKKHLHKLSAELKTLKETQQTLLSEITTLENFKETTSNTTDLLNIELTKNLQTIHNLTSELEETRTTLDTTVTENEDIKKQVQSLQQLTENESVLNNLSDELETLKTSYSSLQKTKEELTKDNAVKEETISRLNSSKESLTKAFTQEEEISKQYLDKITLLEKTIEDYKSISQNKSESKSKSFSWFSGGKSNITSYKDNSAHLLNTFIKHKLDLQHLLNRHLTL